MATRIAGITGDGPATGCVRCVSAPVQGPLPKWGIWMTDRSDCKPSRQSLSHESLMQAAQAGDRQSYTLLLRRVIPQLRQTVRSRRQFLPDAEVEDIVQDILVSLHAVRATYDPRRPFMPWLMAIARNRLADSGRCHARRNAHEVQVADPSLIRPEAAPSGREVYGDPEALRRAIATLPPRQREAVEMVKLREMTLREAAFATGASTGALKVSVHRGINSLRRLLREGKDRAD